MSKFTSVTKDLHNYILDVSLREPDLLRQLREETSGMPDSEMQIAPDQGQFLALLIKLIAAKRTLEVGVFTGYSSLSVALALPDDGRVTACDISEEWTAVARRYWAMAGVAHKIDLHIAPALETLQGLLDQGYHNDFDFAFIDADKEGYPDYYEACLELVRPGGIIALDNMLRTGRVLHPDSEDTASQAIVRMNEILKSDNRVDISLVPIADGLTLARKRD